MRAFGLQGVGGREEHFIFNGKQAAKEIGIGREVASSSLLITRLTPPFLSPKRAPVLLSSSCGLARCSVLLSSTHRRKRLGADPAAGVRLKGEQEICLAWLGLVLPFFWCCRNNKGCGATMAICFSLFVRIFPSH
jgi:hypothetical protein